MKRPFLRNVLFYSIWAILLVITAWKLILVPMYQSYKYHKQDATYTLTEAFSEYEFVLFDRIELNEKIEKSPESQKTQLRQEASSLDKKVAQRAKDLDTALDKVKKYYPHDVLIKKRIHDFQEWKSQSEKKILQSANSDWDLPFLKLQIGVTKALDKAETGYEEPATAENEKIMSLVPAAEDKKLCTVMQQPLAKDALFEAQQIAFFNVGNQYCSHYYSDSTAWGGWGTKSRIIIPTPSSQERPAYPSEKPNDEEWTKNHPKEVSLNEKYGSLPYAQYYNQYVSPLIPKAIETLKNPKENKNICLTGSLSGGPRDPEKDAARAAYVQSGKQYCPPNEIQQGYYGTGVMCLKYCDVLCAEGMTCDCVERCKQTPGVLFKDGLNR